MHFNVVHAANPRYRGGTSSALRAELKAANRYGLSCTLLPFIGRSDQLVGRFEPRVARLLDDLDLPWLTGDEVATCDILFANHPQVFERMPDRPVRVRPAQVVCVVQHPPFDGNWRPQYDFGAVERNLERLFGAPVVFAPVGPKVRAQFDSLVDGKPQLLPHDLFNMIDLDEWTVRKHPPPHETAILGRHSRPARAKWPDQPGELLAAYPDRSNLVVKALGGVPPEVLPWLGSNWQLLPFSENVGGFLGTLDFYVYFHGKEWVEAFGVSIAEAMACGVVTILDPSYETLFEGGAVYTEPAGVLETIERFIASPPEYVRRSAAGRRLVEAKFSLDTYPKRMSELCAAVGLARMIPLPAKPSRSPGGGGCVTSTAGPPAKRVRRTTKRRRLLFVATNGIGLGHITRLMAIAERMSDDVEPIFVTRSAGSHLISLRGFPTDYIPWPVKIGVTDASWNRAYSQELLAAIESFDVAAVVFDGTYPFPGLLDVAAVRPDLGWIWVRRAMWRKGHRLEPELQTHFHLIIEPGELAHDEDQGPTTLMPGPITAVGPILLRNAGDRLPRSEAAGRLGIDPDRFTAALQFGSRRNFDYDELPRLVASELVARKVQLVQIDNPLAPPSEPLAAGIVRRSIYPMADCFSAFDLIVTNAGYNSFHECVLAGMPAIFVPNESPEMDDQNLRATYAHATGLGLRLRYSEIARVKPIIETAMSDDFRNELQRRSARLAYTNGAQEAAEAIEELVFSVKASRPLHEALARA